MRFVQFFILEASPDCNYADRHPACPIKNPKRFASLDTSHVLDEAKMVELIVRVYKEYQFRGLVGFHYYNEPLLSKDMILRVMADVKKQVSWATFVLWTNGSLITPENAKELKGFSQIYITDYDKRDYSFLKNPGQKVVKTVVNFDNRQEEGVAISNTRCLRPYTEFIVDYHGNVHVCCSDWQGLASPGNVFNEDFGELVRRYQEIRDRVTGQKMAEDAPEACLTCVRRWGDIPNFIPTVSKEAQAHANPKLVALRRRQRKCGNIACRAGVLTGSVPVAQVSSPGKKRAPVDWKTENNWLARDGWTLKREFMCGPQPWTDRFRPHPVDIPIYACISTWYESDIVEAAVKNCFAHGVNKVFLVDNESPDNTVEVATKAGAEIGAIFHTDFYEEGVRLQVMNRVMEEVTAKEKFPMMWWLSLDCDEFICVPRGLTLRQYIEGLPECYNIIGVYSLDHYPTRKPANIPGFHPAEFQDSGFYRTARNPIFCRMLHWKHPLLCYFNGKYTVGQKRGLHNPIVRQGHPLLHEPDETLLLHHFPFREQSFTTARLKTLCEPSTALGGVHRSITDDEVIQANGAIKRYRNLELIYSGRFEEAEMPHTQEWKDIKGIPVKAFERYVDADRLLFHRWYSSDTLEAAIAAYHKESSQ